MQKSSRRQMLKYAAGACGNLLLARRSVTGEAPATGEEAEIQISSVSSHTVRISVLPVRKGQTVAIPWNGTLAQRSWGPSAAKLNGEFASKEVPCGNLLVQVSREPLRFLIQTEKGRKLQQLTVDRQTGALSFETGDAPLLGFGEGGPQFDRRGSADS
jgi:alpha-glucosidase/alpha-D-xyloside xylohydrolase